jgi:sulfur transfer protein SufE
MTIEEILALPDEEIIKVVRIPARVSPSAATGLRQMLASLSNRMTRKEKQQWASRLTTIYESNKLA